MNFNDAHELWSIFRVSVCNQLEHTSTERFRNVWHNDRARTAFYTGDLFPRIASDLKFETFCELFRVDMAMGLLSPAGLIPLVWVESENNSNSASQEVKKLACLSGPLKVLITCDEWDETPGAWRHGGRKTRLLQSWTTILQSHSQLLPTQSLFAILVGEWNNSRSTLRFYGTTLDATGKRIEDDSILMERDIGARN